MPVLQEHGGIGQILDQHRMLWEIGTVESSSPPIWTALATQRTLSPRSTILAPHSPERLSRLIDSALPEVAPLD